MLHEIIQTQKSMCPCVASGTDSCLQWWRWNRSWPVCVWLLVIFEEWMSDRGVCMFTLWSSSTCTLGACALFCRWPVLWWKRELKIYEYINAFNSHTKKSQHRWFTQVQEVWNPLNLTSHLILFEITSSSYFYLFSLLGNSILIYLLNINYIYTGLTLP